MKNGLSKEENDELEQRGLVLHVVNDMGTDRWRLLPAFLPPRDHKSTKPVPELAFAALWELGTQGDRLAQRVIKRITSYNKDMK